MGFDLSAYLKDLPVSESDTEERIEYLELDALHSDARNFYELSDLDGLADNIATIGLQQPIRVRKEADAYYIISGHRRAAALRMLAEDGREDLRRVPCIVERSTGSKALDELKLIYANANTRKMTSAETAAQVSRVERLLYDLKEEGFDFPGRMRDHVAEACSVSRTRIANLKVIESNLQPCWSKLWHKSEISEDTALALARMKQADQAAYFCTWKESKSKYVYASSVKQMAEGLEHLRELQCGEPASGCCGLSCSHCERKREHILATADSWDAGICSKCCTTCYKRMSCKDVCPELKEQIAADRAAEKARKAAEKQRERDYTRPQRERIAAFWKRFGEACGTAGEDAATFHGAHTGSAEEKENRRKLRGETKTGDYLPFRRQNCFLSDVECIIECADKLGCTTDYLLLRTDEPNPPKAELSDAGAHWNTGKPPKAGMYYARFFTNPAMCQVCKFNGWNWQFKSGAAIEAECTGWWPLPEDDA